jgi:hypothetical protein
VFGCAIHDGPQTLNRVDRSGVTTRRPKREIKVRGADPRAAVVARSHATDPRPWAQRMAPDRPCLCGRASPSEGRHNDPLDSAVR